MSNYVKEKLEEAQQRAVSTKAELIKWADRYGQAPESKSLFQDWSELTESELDYWDRRISAAKSVKQWECYQREGITIDLSDTIWDLIGCTNYPNGRYPPHDDHGKLLRKEGEPYKYLSMPYGTDVVETAKFAMDWNLDVYEHANDGIWFIGHASGITFRRKDHFERWVHPAKYQGHRI